MSAAGASFLAFAYAFKRRAVRCERGRRARRRRSLRRGFCSQPRSWRQLGQNQPAQSQKMTLSVGWTTCPMICMGVRSLAHLANSHSFQSVLRQPAEVVRRLLDLHRHPRMHLDVTPDTEPHKVPPLIRPAVLQLNDVMSMRRFSLPTRPTLAADIAPQRAAMRAPSVPVRPSAPDLNLRHLDQQREPRCACFRTSPERRDHRSEVSTLRGLVFPALFDWLSFSPDRHAL
jgi:hypothetical protein